MTSITGPILLVGCGKMGSAMLGGWLASGVSPDQIKAVEPADAMAAAARAEHGVEVVADLSVLDPDFAPRAVVIAIKPQMIEAAIPPYGRFAGPDTVFLSIAAGKSIAILATGLGEHAAITRAMPNTPAAIGRGISVLCSNDAVNTEQRETCRALLSAVGEVVTIEDESLLDAVTAVSGSGPAYVFLLIECLAAAAMDAGLPEDLANQLALATVSGAGALAAQSPETAETLRHNVTSPQGTTQAALDVLMADGGLKPLLSRAVAAAADRSRELAE